MNKEIKEILDNPKILMLSYGNYISLDDYVKLRDYITNLQEELYSTNQVVNELLDVKEENEKLKRENYIMLAYLQLIADIGCDCDGLNNIPTLKCLIHELVDYANMGKKLDDKTIISEGSNGEEYNILGEEILQGESK